MSKAQMTKEDVRSSVFALLRKLGANESCKGSLAVAEAVYLYLCNPGMIYGSWCKQMLPEIAANLNCSANTVEIGIKRLICDIWDHDNGATVRRVLGLSDFISRPKVRGVIAWIATTIM